jgi:hypothetical protein
MCGEGSPFRRPTGTQLAGNQLAAPSFTALSPLLALSLEFFLVCVGEVFADSPKEPVCASQVAARRM